jgi:hypothetical protein
MRPGPIRRAAAVGKRSPHGQRGTWNERWCDRHFRPQGLPASAVVRLPQHWSIQSLCERGRKRQSARCRSSITRSVPAHQEYSRIARELRLLRCRNRRRYWLPATSCTLRTGGTGRRARLHRRSAKGSNGIEVAFSGKWPGQLGQRAGAVSENAVFRPVALPCTTTSLESAVSQGQCARQRQRWTFRRTRVTRANVSRGTSPLRSTNLDAQPKARIVPCHMLDFLAADNAATPIRICNGKKGFLPDHGGRQIDRENIMKDMSHTCIFCLAE